MTEGRKKNFVNRPVAFCPEPHGKRDFRSWVRAKDDFARRRSWSRAGKCSHGAGNLLTMRQADRNVEHN